MIEKIQFWFKINWIIWYIIFSSIFSANKKMSLLLSKAMYKLSADEYNKQGWKKCWLGN